MIAHYAGSIRPHQADLTSLRRLSTLFVLALATAPDDHAADNRHDRSPSRMLDTGGAPRFSPLPRGLPRSRSIAAHSACNKVQSSQPSLSTQAVRGTSVDPQSEALEHAEEIVVSLAHQSHPEFEDLPSFVSLLSGSGMAVALISFVVIGGAIVLWAGHSTADSTFHGARDEIPSSAPTHPVADRATPATAQSSSLPEASAAA